MSSIPAAVLIEMPPESKHTPLPTTAIGFVRFERAPLQRIVTSRLSRDDPRPTARSAFMPSFIMAFSSRTSTSTPSFVSAFARSANSAGKSTLAGSFTRLRASSTPAATAKRSSEAARAAAVWLEPTTNSGAAVSSSPLSGFRVLYLSNL